MKQTDEIGTITASEDYTGYRVVLDLDGEEVSREEVDTDEIPTMTYDTRARELELVNVDNTRATITFLIMPDGIPYLSGNVKDVGYCLSILKAYV